MQPESLYQSGGLHYKNQNYREAFRCFELAAQLGHSDSQCMAGIMLDNGQGVNRDFQRAIEWFDRAARQNNPKAEFCLGVMHRDGHGFPQNYREAARLIGAAAAKGNAEAQFNLGVMYLHGHGVVQSLDMAEMWWNRASVHGHPDARTNLTALKELHLRQPNRFTWGGISYSCAEELEGYFTLHDSAPARRPNNREVLVIQEPHYQVLCQWNLFCGLELLMEPIFSRRSATGPVIFLAEGVPAFEEVSLQALWRSARAPSDSTIFAVLRSFLLPGYIAYEWRHQLGIRVYGMEDPNLYGLSARLWEGHRMVEWNSTVAARNKQIAEVIGHYAKSGSWVVAFVGGMHMTAIRDEEFAASVDRLAHQFPQYAVTAKDIRNLGLKDYLEAEGIG